MIFTKQSEFIKKPLDFPDVPSKTMTPAEMKAVFEGPSDELKDTINKVVDDLNAGGWVDNSKLAPKAVGAANLSDEILNQPQTTAEVQAKLAQQDERFIDIATVNVREQGAIADKTTDNTATIDTIIGGLTPPSIVYIPLNIKWDYRNITHPDNIIIVDNSGYDWINDAWTAQRKMIVKTDNPSTKNANENVFIAPYHPAYVVDIADPAGRASYLARRNGSAIWQIMLDVYGADDVFAIKDNKAATDKSVFQFYLGDLQAQEVAFNTTPSSGVSYKFASRYVGTNLVRFISSGTDKDTLISIWANTTETHRITFKTTGDITFDMRGTGKVITMKSDGRLQIQYRTVTSSPVGNLMPDYLGEEVYDSVAKVFYKAVGIAVNTDWKQVTN